MLGKYGVKDYRGAKRFLNKREFLLDIDRFFTVKEFSKKYKTDNRGVSRMIREYLCCYGITNIKEARIFLQSKDIDSLAPIFLI